MTIFYYLVFRVLLVLFCFYTENKLLEESMFDKETIILVSTYIMFFDIVIICIIFIVLDGLFKEIINVFKSLLHK